VEFEIANKIPFTLAPFKMTFSGMFLIKYTLDLYEEYHKTPMK
jgi:hypothetical protein